jgi:hypothetical protein
MQADGRVVIGHYDATGAFSALYTRKRGSAAPGNVGPPASSPNAVTVEAGDLIKVAGTSLACRVGQLKDANGKGHDFVICGLRNGAGFRKNSDLTILEQGGIAEAEHLDQNSNPHRLFARP